MILQELRKHGLSARATADTLTITPSERLTDELREFIRANKPAILAELAAEKEAGNDARGPARSPATAPGMSSWPIKGGRYCYSCGHELTPRQPYLLRENEVDDETRRSVLLARARELLEKLPAFGLVQVVTLLQSMTHSTGVKLQGST